MSTFSADPSVRETLVMLVNDMLTTQPDDVLEFMQAWAESKKKVVMPKVKGTRSARDALRARHARELPSCYSTADGAVKALDALFAQYKEFFHEKREGARDHYMMALEDSGYDIFHLRQLEAKIQTARETEARVAAKQEQTNEYVQAILADTTRSEYTKVERLNQLFIACRDSFIAESS